LARALPGDVAAAALELDLAGIDVDLALGGAARVGLHRDLAARRRRVHHDLHARLGAERVHLLAERARHGVAGGLGVAAHAEPELAAHALAGLPERGV